MVLRPLSRHYDALRVWMLQLGVLLQQSMPWSRLLDLGAAFLAFAFVNLPVLAALAGRRRKQRGEAHVG